MSAPDPIEPPAAGATKARILSAAWASLERAARERTGDLRWPVLASVDARDRARPRADARVVVLRRAQAATRELEVHSDARANKLAQLRDAGACLVFVDRAREVQLRAWGDARIHAGDAVARRAWDALAASSRRAYLAPRTPGTVSDEPDANLPDAFVDRLPEPAEAEAGFANFAAIVLRVDRLEWLELGRTGHRRARFDWPADEGAPRMRWIRP